MIKTGLTTLFLCFTLLLFSQTETDNESCTEPDKKAMKLIKVATSPKSDFQTASMAFLEAIEIDDEKALPYFLYAEYLNERALRKYEDYKAGRANLVQVRNQYNAVESKYVRVIELCPELHATPYYMLGYINYYIKKDQEAAVSYFNQFINYSSNDPDAFAEDYVDQKNEAILIVKQLEVAIKKAEIANEFYETKVPYNPVRVQNVSTADDEYLPMISPDNELIFYTRRGDFRSLGDVQSNIKEMFSVSQRPNVNTPFNKGEGLRPPFNTNEFDNYGGVSLSIDNKEMFICACKNEMVQGQQFLNCDIYVTYFKRSGRGGYDYEWTTLENLGSNINTATGWEAQPTLSADGNTLYFSAYRKSTNLTDIYYSTRKEDGSWSLAKPVPGPINTAGHDKAPFLHQDSETMYFASQVSEKRKGAGEPGNFDIFYSRKDENGNWTEPKNLGYPINTESNEVGLIVSTDGKLAYIATDKGKNAQGVDLYYFELYEAARPQKVLFVKGQLKDDLGDPIQDGKVEINYKESSESVEVNINGDDGKFAAVIKTETPQDVLISVKKKGYSFDTQKIEKSEIAAAKAGNSTYKSSQLALEIGELEVGKAFTINNILFATDSYELSKDAKFVLDQFIKFLKVNPGVSVELEGHTDDQGDDGANMKLSQNRANATKDYIVSKGISKDRLKAIGYGETKPIYENNNETNRAKNRRTDFRLTGL